VTRGARGRLAAASLPGREPYELGECDAVNWKQATSYCEMAVCWFAGVFVLAPLPAYTPPAMPPFSLNAEPRADEAFPGSSAVDVPDRQVWDGWPGVPVLPARLDPAGNAKSASAAVAPSRRFKGYLLVAVGPPQFENYAAAGVTDSLSAAT
jgi:hypothetical protein